MGLDLSSGNCNPLTLGTTSTFVGGAAKLVAALAQEHLKRANCGWLFVLADYDTFDIQWYLFDRSGGVVV
jgi:hypothetical protein